MSMSRNTPPLEDGIKRRMTVPLPQAVARLRENVIACILCSNVSSNKILIFGDVIAVRTPVAAERGDAHGIRRLAMLLAAGALAR